MSQKVLLFAPNITAAVQEVAAAGGRVLHQFGQEALVAELPAAVNAAALTAASTQPPATLSPGVKLAADAWQQLSQKRAANLAPDATEGLPWDEPGYEAPREVTLTRRLEAAAAPEGALESTGTPTSRHLNGSVAVGIVLVSRNAGPEQFTDAERTKIIQEVQEGLDWLATLEPRARVSFVYDIRPVTVTTAPGPNNSIPDAYEKFEAGLRDAALAGMGFAAGRAGYQAYANQLRSTNHTDWSYVAFFTKYPLNHFAYAIFEKVVMAYSNDGWGPDNINKVFAHESCHIFGAADEYGNCSCGGANGELSIPNNNCVNCFPPGAQAECLMNRNSLVMCPWSRKQIGWDDRLFPAARWESLGGKTPGPVAARAWAANRLDLFVRGTDSGIYHKYWNGTAWGPAGGAWESLGGKTPDRVTAVAWGPNRLDAFVRGMDDGIYHKYWNGTAWGPASGAWESLGGKTPGPVTAVAWAANRLDLFVRGTDNGIYHKYWNGTAWGPAGGAWESLGGKTAGPVTAVAWAANRLDLFVRGTDDGIYHKYWNGTAWGPSPTAWEFLGGKTRDAVTAVSWGPNRLDLFVRGTDDVIYHKWWNGSAWGPAGGAWESLGGKTLGPVTAVCWGPNRIDLFVRGTDDVIYHKWWNGSAWGPSPTGWESLGGKTKDIVEAVAWAPNRLDLFVRGTDDVIYHKYWNGSKWGP